MTTPFRPRRRAASLGTLLVLGAVTLSACAAGGSSTSTTMDGTGTSSGTYTSLGLTENLVVNKTMETLSTTECVDANETAELSVDTIAQVQLDQKLQLLLGQKALPSQFTAPGTPDLGRQIIGAGAVVNVSEALRKADLEDEVLPVAKSVIEFYYGDEDLYALPTEFNIEGIWYNKQIFEDNGIDVPETWGELTAAVDTLLAADVQPIVQNGEDPGWGVSRWVGAYIFRDLGPDAMEAISSGAAKLTDPEYVAAADAISALGAKGAFGPAVASTDYNETFSQFLSGNAAMMYMGSWALAAFNDPEQNKIGSENIGFMRFPAVEGGKGAIDQIPANAGQPLMFSTNAYDEGTTAWLECIAQNYGDTVLEESGVISGFKLHDEHELNPLQQVVQEQMETSPSSVVWFEALFSSKATATSTQNAGQLANGSLSGADFMARIQSELE